MTHPIRIIAIFALLVLGAPILGAQERTIGWNDLVRPIEFDDPFDELTTEQLLELGLYVRVKGLRENNPEYVSEAMLQEGLDAEQSLRDTGIDVEELLAKRDKIKQLREQRAYAVVGELDGQQVRMPGFALPLAFEDRKITEFLLVPWVGACIHTPPPPPNQIVYVTVPSGFESQGQFAPVWVSGTMQVQPATKDLYLVDGSTGIDTGYTLAASSVSPYKQ